MATDVGGGGVQGFEDEGDGVFGVAGVAPVDGEIVAGGDAGEGLVAIVGLDGCYAV